jgi:hypothetical protein
MIAAENIIRFIIYRLKVLNATDKGTKALPKRVLGLKKQQAHGVTGVQGCDASKAE